MNMDETSISLYQGNTKGAVFASRDATQRISLGKRRQTLTLVSFVCDNAAMQHLMPQVALCNERTLPKRVEKRVRKALPSHLQLLRKASAWNDSSTLANIVKDLGRRLHPHRERFQPVLLMDACRLHMHRSVLEACASVGIVIVLIPPLTTSMLQPLDVDPYGFNLLKLFLRREFQAARIQGDTIELSLSVFLACIGNAMEHSFLKQNWATVFDRLGFSGNQQYLSDALRQQLPKDADVRVGYDRPDAECLRTCFPKRARISEKLIWKFIDGADTVSAPSAPPIRAALDLEAAILPAGSKRCPLQSALKERSEKQKRARRD